MTQQQKSIAHYGELIDRVRGADAVTERLLISILADNVAQEDEIESGVSAYQASA